MKGSVHPCLELGKLLMVSPEGVTVVNQQPLADTNVPCGHDEDLAARGVRVEARLVTTRSCASARFFMLGPSAGSFSKKTLTSADAVRPAKRRRVLRAPDRCFQALANLTSIRLAWNEKHR